MRKLVVFVMLMTCVISAQAQWKVTPEAGMNVTKYKGDAAKVGFKAGAAVSYTFGSGWFSLQSGLYYVRRGKAHHMDPSLRLLLMYYSHHRRVCVPKP